MCRIVYGTKGAPAGTSLYGTERLMSAPPENEDTTKADTDAGVGPSSAAAAFAGSDGRKA